MKTETKIKLSPKQKEVIRLMREGWGCKHRRLAGYVIISEDRNDYYFTQSSTISKLIKLNVLDSANKLTEFGKTIDIN
jgi:hypothetical protein